MTTPAPWGLTDSDRDGFNVNRPEDKSKPDGTQSAPTVASNHGGEQIGIAFLSKGVEATDPVQVRFQAFDSALGEMAEVLTGPLTMDDGKGKIAADAELSVVGIGDGFAAIWQEQETENGPVVLKMRATSPVGMLGEEQALSATTAASQHSLSTAFYAKVLDENLRTEAVGFTAAWVEGAKGQAYGEIMVQRYHVIVPGLEPEAIEPAGLDGEFEKGTDAARRVATNGRDPSVTALPDGETVVVWIGADEKVHMRIFGREGVEIGTERIFPTPADAVVARVVALEEGSFGVFWSDGSQIWGQNFTPNGEPATSWAAGTSLPIVPGYGGRFTIDNFGGEGGVGGVISYQSGGTIFVQHFVQIFDNNGTPIRVQADGEAYESKVLPSGGDYGMAGLLGGRAVVVGTKTYDDIGPAPESDVFAQIVDTRGDTGTTMLGDRDRGDGRVDARPDILIGTAGGDLITGDRTDTRRNESADDTVQAALGDDTVVGGGDNDVLDGGEGTDIAGYTGPKGQYSITVNGDGSFTVKDMRGGNPDGQDIVSGFEQLGFGGLVPTSDEDGDPNGGLNVSIGTDTVATGDFFHDVPVVDPDVDRTPIAWGMDTPDAFVVKAAPPTAANQSPPVSVGLFGGFGVVWQNGYNSVLFRAYDALGEADTAFGGGSAAGVFTLTEDGGGRVSNLSAAMAGNAGVVAVWEEGGTIQGRFVSSASGLLPAAREFTVPVDIEVPEGFAGKLTFSSPEVAGYEIVDGNNDTQELGFHTVFTVTGIPDQPSAIYLQRHTLYSRAANDPDPEVEGAPRSLGDSLRLTTNGRNASISGLHDGEVVVSWVDGATGKVMVKILPPEGVPGSDAIEFDDSLPPIEMAGAIGVETHAPEVVGLGLNFAVAHLANVTVIKNGVPTTEIHYVAQIYMPGGHGFKPAGLADFGEVSPNDVLLRIVPTDIDGTSFSLLIQDKATGAIRGKLFGIFGGEGGAPGQPGEVYGIGGEFTVPLSDAPFGGAGFTAAGTDDGRVVVTAAKPNSNGTGVDITGSVYDTRVPGEQIIGPRDGAPADLLVGTIGDDVIDGRVRADELHGGLGNDLLLGGSENDTLEGGIGNDTLIGGSENDTLLGGAGNDLLMGGFGADSIDGGGGGGDTLSFQGEFANFSVDLSEMERTTAGTAIVSSNRNPASGAARAMAAEDTVQGIENVTGGAGNDVITGSSGANVLEGGAGNDVLSGGLGPDKLHGGADADVLRGGDGSDVLDGGTGADQMEGGDNNDTYYVDDVGDVVVELGGGGSDTVYYSIPVFTFFANIEKFIYQGEVMTPLEVTGNAGANSISGGSGNDTLAGAAGNDTLLGNGGNDALRGDAGNDNLQGGAGDDLLQGGLGNDAIDGGANNDTMSYAGESARFSINLSLDTLAATGQAAGTVWSTRTPLGTVRLLNLEDTLSGIENAVGGTGNDTIVGSTGSNHLAGDAGQDSLLGGDGQDWLEGGADADMLFGGTGNDVLDGGAGVDRMEGGGNNDTYIVDETLDAVVEAAGGGSDIVESWAAVYVLSANVERLVFKGTGTFSGNGNAGSNTLEGGASADVLKGLAGADVLVGGAGNDSLDGGVGNDVISGGIGDDLMAGGGNTDTFRYGTAGFGNDTITDFRRSQGGDRIDVSALDLEFGDIGVSVQGANTILTFAGGTVTLLGVTGIADSDFIF